MPCCCTPPPLCCCPRQRVLFVLTGSAGSGKSIAPLLELSTVACSAWTLPRWIAPRTKMARRGRTTARSTSRAERSTQTWQNASPVSATACAAPPFRASLLRDRDGPGRRLTFGCYRYPVLFAEVRGHSLNSMRINPATGRTRQRAREKKKKKAEEKHFDFIGHSQSCRYLWSHSDQG